MPDRVEIADFSDEERANVGKTQTALVRWNLKHARFKNLDLDARNKKQKKILAKRVAYVQYTGKGEVVTDNFASAAQQYREIRFFSANRPYVAETEAWNRLLRGGSSVFFDLFSVAILPVWNAFADLIYYHRRPRYNLMRLGIPLLLVVAIAVAITFNPGLVAALAPTIMPFIETTLGTTTVVASGIIVFRLVFGVVGMMFENSFKEEAHHLSTAELEWVRDTSLDEETWKLIKQYLLNTQVKLSAAQDKIVKDLITIMVREDFKVASVTSIHKIARFFMRELEFLQKEQEKRTRAQDPRNRDKLTLTTVEFSEADAKQLQLDIDAVRFILMKFRETTLVPDQIKDAIGVQLWPLQPQAPDVVVHVRPQDSVSPVSVVQDNRPAGYGESKSSSTPRPRSTPSAPDRDDESKH